MKKIFIAIFVFAALSFVLLNTYFEDVSINNYASIKEIKENKAIQHGWIPSILPESAYDIYETHDEDKNILFGKFSYKEQDEEKFIKNLKDTNDANQTMAWKNFLFKIDKEKNLVHYRNKP